MSSLKKLFAAAFFVALAPSASLFAAYSLRIEQTAASDGTSVQVGIDYASNGDSVSALVFTVEYDESRLRFDGRAKTTDSLQNIQVATPDEFTSSSYFLADRKQIGISLYDASLPLASLNTARVATLKFDVLPGASGFAYVRFASPNGVMAADSNGNNVQPSELATGGVTVSARQPFLTVNPSRLDFGSLGPQTTATRRLVVSNDGTGPLTIKRVSIDGNAAFTVSGVANSTVDPGGSRPYDVAVTTTAPGTLAARLTIELSSGDIITVPVTATVLTEGNYAYDSRWFVPALVRSAGGNASVWRTELSLFNSGSAPISVRLTPHDASGEVLTPYILELGPGKLQHIDNVVSTISTRAELHGYLLIESSTPDLIARAAIVNVASDGSKRVEAVPLLAPERAFHTGEKASLIGLLQTATARTNVGVLNVSAKACAIGATLRSADGTSHERRVYVVKPGELAEPIDVITASGVTNERDLSVIVDTDTPDCAFMPYASTIDESGNLTFVYPR